MRRAQALAAEHTRVVVPLPVRQPGQPQGPLRGHRSGDLAGLPRDHPLRRRPRHGGHADGRRAVPQGAQPPVQVWAVQPPAGEMVDGLKNLDEGFIPPVFTDNDGYDLLDRKKVVGPRGVVEWTRRLAEVGIFAGISSGAIMAGGRQVRGRDRRGRHRHHRLRRRLEVPLDRRVDRRPRRGRPSGPGRSSTSERSSPSPGLTGNAGSSVVSPPLVSARSPRLVSTHVDDRPIGMFDSGFGGLTVARAVIDLLPSEDLVYIGDTGRYPYGPRPLGRGPELRASDHRRAGARTTTSRWSSWRATRRPRPRSTRCASSSRFPSSASSSRGCGPLVPATRNGRVGVIGTVGTIASGAYQRDDVAARPPARGAT